MSNCLNCADEVIKFISNRELSNISHANPNHEALVAGHQGVTRGRASNSGCTTLRTYKSPSHPVAIFP
jgi:hypothetical protein